MVTIASTLALAEGAIFNQSDKIHLLDELERCLDEWSRAASTQAPVSDPRVTELRALTLNIQSRMSGAGLQALVEHVESLRQQVDSSGRTSDLFPQIRAIRGLIRESRSASVEEGRAQQLAPSAFPPDLGNPGFSSGDQSPKQGSAAAGSQLRLPPQENLGGGHPQRSSTSSSSAAQPPPMLGASVFLQQGVPELSHLPFAPTGGSNTNASLASVGAPAPPPLLAQSVALPPQIDRAELVVAAPHVGAPDYLAPPPTGHAIRQQPTAEPGPTYQPVAPQPLSSPNPVGPVGLPSSASGKSPNLKVRTMFGLRAFGARPSDTGAQSLPPQPAVQFPNKSDQESSALLGLKRGSRHSSQHPAPLAASGPPAAPRLLDHSLAGLPPLPHTSNPAGLDHSLSSPRFNQSLGKMSRLDVLGGMIRRQDRRGGGASTAPPALLRNRERPSSTWRLGAIAVAIFALVLGGLATLIIVLTRNPEQKVGVATPNASQKSSPAASSAAALPQSRLVTENESVRALLGQMHGRGKESAELSALEDEEAALISNSLSPDKCKGSPAACQAMAAMHASVIGAPGTKRISQRRATGSMDRVRSQWLVGLKLPEIPVEDDPRVQRSLQFYTENPVGRETFQSMLFRCGAYRDLIQSTLVRYELPTDLWAIVFVESGCTPQATSPVGAAGLWQFMPATGRAYHLRIKEDVIDERRSPPKSTEAAVRYLRDIRDKLLVYNEAGVWDLVFGAYNLGPFGLIARLERVGGTGIGFWDLVDAKMLPDETAMYSPAIEAVALILNNLQRYKFSAVQMRTPQLTSDLEVPPGTRLSLVARAAAMSTRDLRSMNLDISGESTPDLPNFALQVPKDVVWQARDTLKGLMASQDPMDQCVPPTFDWGRERFTKEMSAACLRKLGAKNH